MTVVVVAVAAAAAATALRHSTRPLYIVAQMPAGKRVVDALSVQEALGSTLGGTKGRTKGGKKIYPPRPAMPRAVNHYPKTGVCHYESRSGGTVLRGLDGGWWRAVFELSPLSAVPRVPAATPHVHQHLAGLDHVKIE